jgi:hypothetical protein
MLKEGISCFTFFVTLLPLSTNPDCMRQAGSIANTHTRKFSIKIISLKGKPTPRRALRSAFLTERVESKNFPVFTKKKTRKTFIM